MNRATFLKTFGLGVSAPFVAGSMLQADPAGDNELNPHFVNSGSGFGNRVSITFDDGPSPGVTEKVLKELAARNLTATFFMIGNKVREYASLAKQVADAGHELANHTYTHPNLKNMSESAVNDQLKRCQDAIGETTGKYPVWFRPPYGSFRTQQGPIASQYHLGIAYWSVDPRDWAKPGASQIVSRVVSHTKPGSIILLHDLHGQTAEAVGEILDSLLEKSFLFTPMTRFLGHPYPETLRVKNAETVVAGTPPEATS